MIDPKDIEAGASFSPCRRYRYDLLRAWGPEPFAMFIGLNPSTADEVNNDPTVRRCIRYARDWGYGGLIMTNIFAFRATDPKVMKACPEPVGPGNDAALIRRAGQAGIVVAAWGTHGAHLERGAVVRNLLADLHCLRLTKDGHPSHPLYLPAHLEPLRWPSSEVSHA